MRSEGRWYCPLSTHIWRLVAGMPEKMATNIERLHSALAGGIIFLVVALVGYWSGFRGKGRALDSATTWADLLEVAPSCLVLSVLVGGCVYFSVGRRR